MAEMERLDADSYALRQHHCALCRVASDFPQICQQEMGRFAALLDAEVTREQHLARGDRVCSFVIRRRTGS